MVGSNNDGYFFTEGNQSMTMNEKNVRRKTDNWLQPYNVRWPKLNNGEKAIAYWKKCIFLVARFLKLDELSEDAWSTNGHAKFSE